MSQNNQTQDRPVVIVHPRDGIYVGHALGFAFWSNLDAVGQPAVPSFPSEAEARAHVASWAGDYNPDDYHYPVVEPDYEDNYCTPAALRKAGLEEHLGELAHAAEWNQPAGHA